MSDEPQDNYAQPSPDLDFGQRLRFYMLKRGLNQAELARKASDFMPDGKTIERSNINGYAQGKNVPDDVRLAALAAALSCSTSDLLPPQKVSWSFMKPDKPDYPVSLVYLQDGRVQIKISKIVDVDTAFELLSAINRYDKGIRPTATDKE